MDTYVTDTHPLHWHLEADNRLSGPATRVFQAADQGQARILIPFITLIELRYLVEKQRMEQELLDRLLALLQQAAGVGNYAIAPSDLAVIRAFEKVPWSLIPEMPDRLITATALALNVPLLTKDSKIRAANVVQVVW